MRRGFRSPATVKRSNIEQTDPPKRIQMRRTKGWRKPAGALYCGRPGLLGNPFAVALHGQKEAVDLHRRWLEGSLSPQELRSLSLGDLRQRVLQKLPELRGRDLGCWCRLDQPCHVDTLLRLANDQER